MAHESTFDPRLWKDAARGGEGGGRRWNNAAFVRVRGGIRGGVRGVRLRTRGGSSLARWYDKILRKVDPNLKRTAERLEHVAERLG